MCTIEQQMFDYNEFMALKQQNTIKMKTKLFSLLFFLLESINAVADTEVTVGCLKYSLAGISATVVGYTDSELPSDLVIPEEIEYNNLKFTVEAIKGRAFIDCQIIKTITTPMTLYKILGDSYSDAKGAFGGCKNLEKADLPGVISIQDYAFSGCTKLKTVKFGENLQYIGRGAFNGCQSLTYLVLPSSLKTIFYSIYSYYPYYNAFNNCPMIQSIIYLGNYVDTGLNNAVCYYITNHVTWSSTSFNYTGSAPSPTYSSNLPAGFQPIKRSEFPVLEKDAGTYTQNVPFTFANDDMSFDAIIPYTYTIIPITLMAKVKDASRKYGDGNPQFSSTYTGFVNNEDASVITSNGTYTTTAKEISDVGTYVIKQTGATAQNYVFEYEDGTLTINKAPLTMTANDKNMTYGNTIPTLDAKFEGLKNNETKPIWNNEPIITTTATSASKVGTYPITISNADAKNYQLTINNGTMTIDKAELTVKADDKSRIYGDANPEFTLSYTGLQNNESVPEWEIQPIVETTSDVKSPIGTYPITVKDAKAVNYNITTVNGTLTISKAALQIIPNDATRMYGADNPKFTLSYSGLKNNENEPEWATEPVITTTATKESATGKYAIQITSAEASNYTLEKKAGTLTITKAPLSVGVKSYSRKYGETNPTFELHYSGLLNGETTPEWTEFPTISTDANTYSDVGEYSIVAAGGVMKNYEATEMTSGILSITPASLTIKANDASRQYFDENPSFSFTCTGFIGNDDSSVFSTMPQLKTDATKYSNVGVYAIEISGAISKNYTLSYEKGQLTIHKRQLIVSTQNYTRAYGEENPSFELRYTGFVNNEDEKVLISKPKVTTEATPTTDVGVYDIIIANGVAENYDFNYINGLLTIEKAYQTLTWDQDLSEVNQYDQVELTAIASSGLEITYTIEGDQICSITKIGKKQYLDCYGIGEIVIVAIQEGNKNYWQSTKRYKTIVIKSPSIIQGDANGDGKVDGNDIQVIVYYIESGNTDGFYFKNADMNGDYIINVADIVMIVNKIMSNDSSSNP